MSVRSRRGSEFIRCFVKALRQGTSVDSIARKVTSEMAINKFRMAFDDDIIQVTMIPQIESSLRKILIF